MKREILRERNGFALVAIYESEENPNKVTGYQVYGQYNPDVEIGNGNGTVVFYRGIDCDENKEIAYMYALSEYLEKAKAIEKSIKTLENEFKKQSVYEYEDLFGLCKTALRKLKENDLLEEIDLDEDEKEIFDVADMVMLKTYYIRKVVSTRVTVAVEKDMSDYQIEDRIENVADDISNYDWDFEEYDVIEDNWEEVSKGYAEDNCDYNFLDD